jgi:hypothetical protein
LRFGATWADPALPASISAIEANRHIARAVATTPYLQRMHDGTLSPLDYGCLTVQDGPTPARCD